MYYGEEHASRLLRSQKIKRIFKFAGVAALILVVILIYFAIQPVPPAPIPQFVVS